jgi:hypothetical protein
MSREATTASSSTPHQAPLSSERARMLARLSCVNLTPSERRARTLPARLAAAQQLLAQLDDQREPQQDGGAP